MKTNNFGAFNHLLVKRIPELLRNENKYQHFTLHKGEQPFLRINLRDNAVT
jgi:hypothetical protein